MSKQLSRIETYGRKRTRGTKHQEEHQEHEELETSKNLEKLPSRTQLHPSRGILTRIFYNTLMVLFILLLLGLLYWGRHYTS
ncbi:hypothetical protein BVG16_03620 [Paenibacillus selenitireducens]|uniref:Uncharacterized protein n=1 Tax=Paenibacillus selenitireducens TaxID=1324314 RepID=A0A1T2XNF6_9BACL|nr:hypothetical protein BVG16_03620 [Paenibacillus selenitireducens]